MLEGFPFRNPRNAMFTANTALWGVHFWEPLEHMKKSGGDAIAEASASASQVERSRRKYFTLVDFWPLWVRCALLSVLSSVSRFVCHDLEAPEARLETPAGLYAVRLQLLKYVGALFVTTKIQIASARR